MLRKIDCNATNSAVIDNFGNVYVWGSVKYGLCGNCDPESKQKGEKGNNTADDSDDDSKNLGIPAPQQMTIYYQENPQDLEIYNLLDPDPKNTQIFAATHLSIGSYHAGIVCNDVSTNYEFVPVPLGQKLILDEFKNYLLSLWDHQWKQKDEEVCKLIRIYNERQLDDNTKASKDKDGKTNVAFTKQVVNALINTKQDAPDNFGNFPVQHKIEYMLKFFTRIHIKECYPYVPDNYIQNLMRKNTKLCAKDPINFEKLFDHLRSTAKIGISKLNKDDRDNLQKYKNQQTKKSKKEFHYVNLKEFRDQIIGRRCSNGLLFMYGMANEGRLGGKQEIKQEIKQDLNKDGVNKDGTKEDHKIEKKGLQLVNFKSQVYIKKVECGSSFTIALTTDGIMYSWGFGKSGSLGLGEQSSAQTPEEITKLYNGDTCQNMTDISCGSSHSLSVDNKGRIYSWGNGQGGRLGHNQEVGENVPRQIAELEGKYVKFIEAGDASSACITSDQLVYLWGSGLNGRLGNGAYSNLLIPQISMELKDKIVGSIFKGTNTTFAIMESGQVFGWGSSKSGKLGFDMANGKNYPLPKEIISLKDLNVFSIAAGPFHTLVLASDGSIHAMGNSKDGKLGFENLKGQIVEVETPTKIDMGSVLFYKYQVQKVQIKQYPLFNDYDDMTKLKPIFKQDLPFEINYIACGENYQMFITNNGELWSCGSNKCGQLGLAVDDESEEEKSKEENEEEENKEEENKNDVSQFITDDLQKRVQKLQKRVDQEIPQKINFSKVIQSGTKRVSFVAVGSSHTVVILEGGVSVFSWGKNNCGQLGIGLKGEDKDKPQRIKTFGDDNQAKQVACGENHSVFLTQNGSVFTCGSNQFGQLGLEKESSSKDNQNASASENATTTPTLIEKSILDNIVFISAGRYHTVAIKKSNDEDQILNDQNNQDDETNNTQIEKTKDKEDDDKAVIVDIKHEVYSWGRGYHGQLGHRDLKIVQWSPKLVKIKRDMRFKDEDQPYRFAMVTCGEKHTILLAINGNIWWAGEKISVGIDDPNQERKNKYDPKNEIDSFQYTFDRYFDQEAQQDQNKYKYKFVSSNFNSKINFAINEKNQIFVFGEGISFREYETNKQQFVFAQSGKNFQALINVERVPYSWGDTKNGRLGLDLDDVQKNQDRHVYVKKEKKVQQPIPLQLFQHHLRDQHKKQLGQNDDKDKFTEQQMVQFLGKYNKKFMMLQNFKQAFMKIAKTNQNQDGNQIEKNSDSDQEVEEQLMFPIQEQLKEKDQNEFEKTLIQQDIDLIINFKECIQLIYENIQQIDRNTRSALMKATDSICARIETFPIQTIQKNENIDEFVPKLIIFNKQLYEILFTLLQTHPCYLINWLMGSVKKEICLWDFHPLAFPIDDDENIKSMWTLREKYQSFSEKLIQHDDECTLILIIYGGMKCIFNNKRIINNIMMIGIQIFELELKESLDSKSKYHSNFNEIITGKQKKDPCFTKIQRLVFQSSSQNQQFTEELLNSIIFLLQKMKFEDGIFRQKPEDGQPQIQYKMDVFDYDGVISDVDKSLKRSQNLRNFLEKVIQDVLIKNIELESRLGGKNDCQTIFSNETLLMNINAYQSLIEKSQKLIDKKYSSKNLTDEEKENKEQEKLTYEDYARQFCLKNIFEDLCNRLQNIKVCDIHQAFSNKIENNDWNSLSNHVFPFGVRNNYYFIGRALRQFFSGEKILYSADSVIHIRQFMDKHGREFRQKIWESIQSLKTKDDINNINQVLVKLTIEEAMEPFNDICTVQLRDIVYLHNQLISYGEKVFIKGFEQTQDTKKEDQNANQNEDEQVENEEDENQQSTQISEMDPLKIIFEQLGNQYIILKTQKTEYIPQQTLNRSINLKIQSRIFENFNEIIRCSDCNGIVYEGLIPKQRFTEGLNMKAWNCANSQCRFKNTNEMSLQCKQCQSPRPHDTLPKDMMFQLYAPLNPNDKVNQQILKFEKMLQVCQVFQEDQNLEEELAKIKKEEKKKEKGIDYDKLSIIEDFLEMRENHIKSEMKKINNTAQKKLGPLVPKDEEKKIEDQLYEKLLQRIKDNMEKRTNHQDILDKNNEFIIFLRDKAQQVASRNKNQLDLINLIQKNAKSGTGNEIFSQQSYDEFGLFSGRLDKLNNQEKNNDGKKKEEKKKDELKDGDLGKYFAEIERKQKLQPAQPKLQKKLEENRERRNMMKSQFGQFASFPALELQNDGVINSVKINGKNIDNIIKQCKYLFYEIKEDLQMLKEGGYRVELSFDETGSGICGSASADSRQTILSTFVIDNPMIIEMRRLMATKASINLVGTEFNIFKLIQKINSIKTKSQQYVN